MPPHGTLATNPARPISIDAAGSNLPIRTSSGLL
jgi:hypothetical protein